MAKFFCRIWPFSTANDNHGAGATKPIASLRKNISAFLAHPHRGPSSNRAVGVHMIGFPNSREGAGKEHYRKRWMDTFLILLCFLDTIMAMDTTNTPNTIEQERIRREETSRHIAESLAETERGPKASIWRSVKVLGVEKTLDVLAQALAVDSGEGMLTGDGTRKRTKGGIYFALIRQLVKGKDHAYIFLQKSAHSRKQQEKTEGQKQSAPVTPVQPFHWEDRIEELEHMGTEKGRATTVKITLVGQLGKIIEKDTCIIAAMVTEKIPALPKGLPEPPAETATYTIFIAKKQFKKIADAANDPEDVVIIEGWGRADMQTQSVAVWATNVTSKKLQQAMRQTQGSTISENER